MLKRIRKSEADVQAMIEEAERHGDGKLAQARRDVDRIIEQGLADVDRRSEEASQKAQSEIQHAVGSRIEKGREAVESMREGAVNRLPRAVDNLVSEFERSVLSESTTTH